MTTATAMAMTTTIERRGWLGVACALALAACGGGGQPPADVAPGAWRQVRAAVPGVDPPLHAVAADPGRARYVVAGWEQTVLTGRGSQWTPIPLGDLLAAYAAPRGTFERVWAGAGRVLVTGGLGFYAGGVVDVAGPSPTIVFGDPSIGAGPWMFGGPVDALAGAEDQVWVGGADRIAHFDGTAWTLAADQGVSFQDLWAHPDGTLWAATPGGVYTRAPGDAWQPAMITAPDEHAYDLWSDGQGTVVTVGVGLHFEGETRIETGLAWVRRDGAWSRFAAGVEGGLPAGTGWLHAVWGRGPGDVYAAGNQGVLLHFDGAAWHRVDIPTTAALRGIAGMDGELVVVGDDGIWTRGS